MILVRCALPILYTSHRFDGLYHDPHVVTQITQQNSRSVKMVVL